MEADPYVVGVLYLIIQRISAQEYVAQLPVEERPTRDLLEHFKSHVIPDEELAWSDVFPQLCEWIMEHEHKRNQVKQELNDPNDLSQYNYRL